MQAAYHVQDFQIVGGPEWVKSDVYEVDAKASGNPQVAQMPLTHKTGMLRSPLAQQGRARVSNDVAGYRGAV